MYIRTGPKWHRAACPWLLEGNQIKSDFWLEYLPQSFVGEGGGKWVLSILVSERKQKQALMLRKASLAIREVTSLLFFVVFFFVLVLFFI